MRCITNSNFLRLLWPLVLVVAACSCPVDDQRAAVHSPPASAPKAPVSAPKAPAPSDPCVGLQEVRGFPADVFGTDRSGMIWPKENEVRAWCPVLGGTPLTKGAVEARARALDLEGVELLCGRRIVTPAGPFELIFNYSPADQGSDDSEEGLSMAAPAKLKVAVFSGASGDHLMNVPVGVEVDETDSLALSHFRKVIPLPTKDGLMLLLGRYEQEEHSLKGIALQHVSEKSDAKEITLTKEDLPEPPAVTVGRGGLGWMLCIGRGANQGPEPSAYVIKTTGFKAVHRSTSGGKGL